MIESTGSATKFTVFFHPKKFEGEPRNPRFWILDQALDIPEVKPPKTERTAEEKENELVLRSGDNEKPLENGLEARKVELKDVVDKVLAPKVESENPAPNVEIFKLEKLLLLKSELVPLENLLPNAPFQ